MGAPDTVPDLQYQKQDGSPLTRIEMEHQIRDVWKRVHSLRIQAGKVYGLQKQHSFGMKEAVLRHWVLDEMVRRGQIIGDQVGVNINSYDDDNENRQFIQRLTAMIQAGQALSPREGEGVDMSNMPQQPPPPVGPNGQSGYAPPAPPMGAVPQGYAPPSGPPGYAPPAPPFSPPGVGAPPGMAMPPAPPQGFAPAGPPQGFTPAGPPQGYAPPQGAPPMMPPGHAPAGPPMGAPPMAPPSGPPQGAAPTGGRGRGKKGDGGQQAAPPPAQPVPPMGQQGYAPPQGAAPGFPPMPQAGGFPGFPGQQQAAPQQPPAPQQQQAPAAQVDLGPVLQVIQQQAGMIASLERQVAILNMGCALMLRVAYGKQGAADMASILQEIGVQVPQ